MLSAIALKKEGEIETVKIKTIIARFGIVFKRIFTPDELQTILDIYGVRNCFIHGYKPDDKVIFDVEDLTKRMGTIWEKISIIAVPLFGKENIKKAKPKKKYTEKELEEVLEDEVRKMIKSPQSRYPYSEFRVTPTDLYKSPFSSLNKCPRCGSYSFSSPENKTDWLAPTHTFNNLQWDSGSNLYKCKECNLELTEKQYEIAKKIFSEKSPRLPP